MDSSGRFVFTANQNDITVSEGSVAAWTFDPISGNLNPAPGSPFPSQGYLPVPIAADPSGLFVYTSNQCRLDNFNNCTLGNIAAFAIDQSTAALTPVPGSPFNLFTSSVMAVTAAGQAHFGAYALSGIQVLANPATVQRGQTYQFTAVGLLSDGTFDFHSASATWTSSDPSIATVSSTGLVTGVAAGSATITACYSSFCDSATLTVTAVNSAPAITSANSTTFTVAAGGSFTVTTTGFPTPTLSETGTLPGGVAFNSATGVLSGTPVAGSAGTYPITFTASNGVGSNAVQNFTLTVNQGVAPAITSAANTTFIAGTAGSFTVTATGVPTPTLNESGSLPSGVTFTDNLNGTGTLSGTPASGTGGIYNITFTPNGAGSGAVQSFTLTVDQAPAITSANSTTFTAVGPGGSFAGSFTVTATGFPAPALTETGTLPSGVSFNASTGALSGTPAAGTGGTYNNISFTANNGVGTPATQSFTLVVYQDPAVTSPNSTTFTVGTAGSFTVTGTGFPTPSFSLPPVSTSPFVPQSLPAGVTFVDSHDGTATLSGTPATGTGGHYPIVIVAVSNGVPYHPFQTLALTVDEAPAITSAASTTFIVGQPSSFQLTAFGFPVPTYSESGSLPPGVTLDGGGFLSGTPAAGSTGTYAITITANNGVGSNTKQSFTLTVNQFPAFTSANGTAFNVGTAGSFTVTATGVPAPTLSEFGALPNGLAFNPATGVLSGTPGTGTAGVYNISFSANNGVGGAVQNFTLSVNQPPAITSAASTTFTVGTAGFFAVSATGFPAPTLSETGTLPSGVTFNGGVLSGMPGPGTGGAYNITFQANGAGSNAVQNFTLTVNNTPGGTNVGVQPVDATTGASPVTLTFSTITQGGVTSLATSSTGPAPSAGFALGSPAEYYNLSTTAVFSGLISICINYTGITFAPSPQLFHYNGSAWVSVTTSVDTVNHIICGSVTSLSPFAIFQPTTQPPAITSGNNTTFTAGTAGSFTVTATGVPTPTLSETGTLPSGVTFNASNGVLGGTPGAGTGGTYNITFTANNGVGTAATQTFVLTVNQAPAVTSGNRTSFTFAMAGSFTVMAAGFPMPTLSETGTLPSGVNFNTSTGVLSGTPASGAVGTYNLTFGASNGVGTAATQSFSLTVHPATQTIALTGVPSSATFGQGPFTISASATSGLPVSLAATGRCVLSAGMLSLTGVGSCTLTATQGGNSDYNPAPTLTPSFAIGQDPTTTVVSLSPGIVKYSDYASFTVTITPASAGGQILTGNAQFYLNGNAVGAAVSISSAGVATLPQMQVNLPAGSYPVKAVFTSTNSNFTGGSGSTSLTVTEENAFVLYSGDTIAQVGSSLALRATVWDSAAVGYPGTNPETGAAVTIGDVTKMWIAFDIYPAGSCGSGTPSTLYAQVALTSTAGVGTATSTFSSASEASYCVISRVVAGSTGGTNLFYAAPYAEPVGVDFYVNSGQFATGGGWVSDPSGSHGNFGFNARYNSTGSAKGQTVYIYRSSYNGVAADFVIKSNALTALQFSGTKFPISSTLQGKVNVQINRAGDGYSLFSAGNYTFSAIVTDSGQTGTTGKQFSLIVYDTNGVPYHSVSAGTPLQGGNVVVHSQ
jgi:hypothetical protein